MSVRFGRRWPALVVLSVLLVSACGDDDDPTAPTPLPTGTTTVVLGDGDSNPVDGGAILHHDSTGALLAEAATDAAGRASIEITQGDWITARQPRRDSFSGIGGSTRMFTVLGVEPDESLRFMRDEFESPPTSNRIELQGSIPEPQDAVLFGTPCTNGGGRVTLPYTFNATESCGSDSGLFHILMMTQFEREKQAYNFATDIVLDESGSTTAQFDGPWRTDWQDLTFVFPDPGFAFESARLSPWPERDGATYYNLETWDYDGPSSLDGHVLRLPRDFIETVRVEMSFDTDTRQAYLRQRIAIDESMTVLAPDPPVPSLTILPPDFSTPGRPVLRWTVDTDGTAGDYIRIAIGWEVGDERYSWSFYLPPGARSLRLPELPDGFFGDVPTALDDVSSLWIFAEYEDSSLLDGYDDVRPRLPYRADTFDDAEGQVGYSVSANEYLSASGEGDKARFDELAH